MDHFNDVLTTFLDLDCGSRGAATDSEPPGQHIHSGPPGGGGGYIDYTVSAIKIVQFCM